MSPSDRGMDRAHRGLRPSGRGWTAQSEMAHAREGYWGIPNVMCCTASRLTEPCGSCDLFFCAIHSLTKHCLPGPDLLRVILYRYKMLLSYYVILSI